MSRLINFYRAIVIKSVHDFGLGEMEPGEFESFVNTDHFIDICGFAEFDYGWVRKIFKSISEEPEEVRGKITRDVVRLMKNVRQKDEKPT